MIKEIEMTICQILNYNVNEQKSDDIPRWQKIVSRVERWNRSVGFDLSWHNQKEGLQTKSVILPVFYAAITKGNRRDETDLQVNCILPAQNNFKYQLIQIKCTLPECETVISGRHRRKNFMKHFCLHWYTVRNRPCLKCGEMDDRRNDNHRCEKLKKFKDITDAEKNRPDWICLTSIDFKE